MAATRRQVQIRLAPELLARIDERAQSVGLDRNKWLIKAAEWILDQPVKETTTTRRVTVTERV